MQFTIWITDPLLFLRVNNNVKSCTLCWININPTFFKFMLNMKYLGLKTNFILCKEYEIISELHIFNDAIIMYDNITG